MRAWLRVWMSAWVLLTGAAMAGPLQPSVLSRASGRVLVVTQLGDSGPGSLRNMIEEAAEREGSSVVRFADGLQGTIALQSPIRIGGGVAVSGPGAHRLTVDAAAAGSAFVIESATSVIVGGLRITGAERSAIVARKSDLVVDHCELVANRGLRGGGLLLSGGVTTVRGTLVANNFADWEPSEDPLAGTGGGISLERGDLELIGSRLHFNQANLLGGGLHADLDEGQALRIVDSLIDGNVAPTQGGGLFLLGGKSLIVNSTVSGNRSERNAALWFSAAVDIISSTVADNQSVFHTTPGQCPGLCASGNARLRLSSSIVAHNRTAHGHVIDLASAGVDSVVLDHALVFGPADEIAYTDLGGNRLRVDPGLQPLQPGGRWLLHALAADSPALDAGRNPLRLAADQRGGCHLRHAGTAPDIGAYERQSVGTCRGRTSLPPPLEPR